MKKAVYASLAFVLVAACACGRTSSEPEIPQLRRVEAAGWSLLVPEGWPQVSPGLFVGKDNVHVLVSLRENPDPLESLAELNVADLLESHADYEVLERRMGRHDGGASQTVVGRFTTLAGTQVTQMTVVVDGGKRKAVMTFAARRSQYAAAQETFLKIAASFTFIEGPDGG